MYAKNSDGKKSFEFHDFIDASKISVIFATFQGYKLASLPVQTSTQATIGEGNFYHSDLSSLTDEGSVINISARLSMFTDKPWTLEQRITYIKDDGSVETTPYAELGKIENCEPFEAVWSYISPSPL